MKHPAKRVTLVAVLIALCIGLNTTSAKALEFGVKALSMDLSTPLAGEHADITTSLTLPGYQPSGPDKGGPRAEDIVVNLPPGFSGNPNLTPRCRTGDLYSHECPVDSQVGIARLTLSNLTGGGPPKTLPVFNLVPVRADSEVARFGIWVGLVPVYLDVSVRTAGDYGITVGARSLSYIETPEVSEVTIWGNPSDPSHDKLRMTIAESGPCQSACTAPNGERASGLPPIAFLSNPSACGPGEVSAEVSFYQAPGQIFTKTAPVGPITDCTGLPFAPTLEARPTTDVAGAPTGLRTRIFIPQHSDPTERATATMRETRIAFPEGMAINPAAADGLAACSDQQVHFHEEARAECPEASKLGAATITSPALARPLQGALYQRTPGGPGNQFGLWLVSDDLGLHIHIPGSVKADPESGRLTAIFTDLPPVPTEEIEVEIWGGAKAPLKNPDHCGTFTTTSVLAPHSADPPATPTDSFAITRSPNGGPCPDSPGAEPNSPDFEAGTARQISATYSPLLIRAHRQDGSQPFGALELTLPPGLTGKLAGVGECPEAALAAAAHKSGTEERQSPSCPASSLLGSVRVAAGAGPAPFWVGGLAYLAGPYQGAPLSVAVISPALAGPFDLGTVVVRSAAHLDPSTAQITVSAKLPTILEGVPLNIRTIAVDLDRDRFTLNGTNCDPLAFSGTLTSALGSVAPLAAPFQLAECARLPFKPKLSLALEGSTRRTSNPALVADLKARPGDANIARAQVKLPPSAFLDNDHIGTLCTRVQFAADQCPKRSVYGTAWATTPLLDYRVSGSVYLRSSDHPLPDLVVKLEGPPAHPLQFDLLGRTDSVKGALRNTFDLLPDVPVKRFHLELFGGKRGLVELSSGLCRRPQTAILFAAQNGRLLESHAPIGSGCPRAGKKPGGR